MRAMQHARRVPLAAAAAAALALAVGGVKQAPAQQAPASAAPRSTFPNIRSPLSAGLNPAVTSPFIPDIRQPLSGAFAPGSIIPDIRNPLSGMFTPGPLVPFGGTANLSPFIPDIRRPLSGGFNPAGFVPFNGVFGTAATVPGAGFPTAGGFPVANGFPTNTGLGGATFFVTPWGETVVAQPVAVPVYVPVPVSATQGRSAAAVSRTTRRRLSDRPVTDRVRGFSAATRERLSVDAAEQMMARVPLTEGTVISDGAQGVRVRVGAQVRRYSKGQVFFFTSRGELRSGTMELARLARGQRVLVPVAATARGS